MTELDLLCDDRSFLVMKVSKKCFFVPLRKMYFGKEVAEQRGEEEQWH